MKKYFILSDIHSFYTSMLDGLNETGFEKDNLDHILIVLGDLFDRGDETIEVFEFLKSIPKHRLILVKGNHECLFNELIKKVFPDGYDFSNGTVKTFCHIANNELIKQGNLNKKFDDEILYNLYYSYYTQVSPIDLWKEIVNLVKISEIYRFINKKSNWFNYFELGQYIFVHSFIPVKLKKEFCLRYGDNFQSDNPKLYEYDLNWRNSSSWEQAMWGCPFDQFKAGLFKPETEKGKILVCGHWHTSDFFRYLNNDYSYNGICGPIYLSSHLIGLDGGVIWSKETGYTHKQNVLVIEEEKLINGLNEKI